MARFKGLRYVALVLVVGLAGTAAAFYVRSRREVTTSSAEALKSYRLGRENEQKLYDREALAAYAEALRHDPHFVMATIRLAGFMRGRDPQRAKSLVESVSRHRDEITPREELALRIFEAQQGKDPDKVDALVDELVRRYPEDPEGYQMRANRLARRGKVDEAVAEYQRLLAVNPNYAVAYNSLGYYHAKMGDYAKAEDYLKRYRFLAPEQANPYDSLGELYANIGRYDEAEESLTKALAIKPDFYPSVAHLGTVAVGRGDMLAAAKHYARAAELVDNPGARIEFHSYAAFSLAAAGKPDEAKQTLATIQSLGAALTEGERKRLSTAMAFNQAAVLARLGETEIAEGILGSIPPLSASTDDGSGDKGYSRDEYVRNQTLIGGLLAHARGRHAEAVAAFETGLPRKEDLMGGFAYLPYSSLVRVALAECLRNLGRAEEAEKALQPVLARNPRFEPAVGELARVRESVSETVAKRS